MDFWTSLFAEKTAAFARLTDARFTLLADGCDQFTRNLAALRRAERHHENIRLRIREFLSRA